MAGDWIKMRRELMSDPDVVEIAAKTNLDEFGVVGRLHAVWSWLDQHSDDGTNVRIVSAFLDRLTACSGFADAMRTVGWLGGRDGALAFPGYLEHNGETAKRRATETKRKQRQREGRDKCPANDGTESGTNAGPEKRREEKKKEHAPAGGEPAAPKVKKEPTSEHAKFIDDWMAYYLKRTGQPYPFGGRDGKAAAQLLKHFGGIEPAKDFIKAVHKRTGDGYPFSNAETLYDFANNIAKLQAALTVNGQKPTASLPSSKDLYEARG